jgi:hypothetical protein
MMSELTRSVQKRPLQHFLLDKEEQSRNSWAIVGLSIGVLVVALVRYLLVRRRMAQQELEDLERKIEVPLHGTWNVATKAKQSRSAAEIHMRDDVGTTVASVPTVLESKAGPLRMPIISALQV